jgi:3-dehydroquinate synthase
MTPSSQNLSNKPKRFIAMLNANFYSFQTRLCYFCSMESNQISSDPFIVIGRDSLKKLNSILSQYQHERIIIVCDVNTKQACLPILLEEIPQLNSVPVFEMLIGEANKSLSEVERLCSFLLDEGAGRKSVILNLGGGIVCDLGGFAASIYMRGIDFIQIPTSLLAMVDASVGGKTGVNFGGLKNMLGTFSKPQAVLVFPDFIQTLPVDERTSGFAEMVKHALLSGDDDWEEISKFNIHQTSNWSEIIEKSIRFKYQITQADFQEKGIREQLNFGHTMAHAFEALAFKRNEDLLHGFAVASGILAELILADQLHILTDSTIIAKYVDWLKKHFILFHFNENELDSLLQFMHSDKKNKQGNVTFSLIRKPGQIALNTQADNQSIEKALKIYMKYAAHN